MTFDIYDVPDPEDRAGAGWYPGSERASDAEYRTNWSGWALTGRFTAEVAPDLWARIDAPWINDGSGLPAAACRPLADALEEAVRSGRAAAWLDAQRGAPHGPIADADRAWWGPNLTRWIAFLRAVQGRFAIY